MDFWNDGDAVGGCVAGGRGFMHINANGDVAMCFVHYSDANIPRKPYWKLTNPAFHGTSKSATFNENMLRPVSFRDNPYALARFVEESGAHSTDLMAPESARDYCSKCVMAAVEWAPVAEEIWEAKPNKRVFPNRQNAQKDSWSGNE